MRENTPVGGSETYEAEFGGIMTKDVYHKISAKSEPAFIIYQLFLYQVIQFCNVYLFFPFQASDLMPFVVFVAPPSLERLRRWKMERSEPVASDDELMEIIERAREMEEAYGHYFDMVSVFNIETSHIHLEAEAAFHQFFSEKGFKI